MTRKNANKTAAREQQRVRSGKYQSNLRRVAGGLAGRTTDGHDEPLEVTGTERLCAAVAMANRYGVNPHVGVLLTDGISGGLVYTAVRAAEREYRACSYPSLIPGFGTSTFDTEGPRSLTIACFDHRNDDAACIRILRQAARDVRSHFYTLQICAKAQVVHLLGTIEAVVGEPASLVSADRDELLGTLHKHVAIAELWPDRRALASWLEALIAAVSERFPRASDWWTFNRRLPQLRDQISSGA